MGGMGNSSDIETSCGSDKAGEADAGRGLDRAGGVAVGGDLERCSHSCVSITASASVATHGLTPPKRSPLLGAVGAPRGSAPRPD